MFSVIKETFKSYTYGDKLASLLGIAVFFLMIVKMIVFPYGVFGFGTSNVYTEGIVSSKGIQMINPLFVQYNDADRTISELVFSGLMKYDPEKKAIVDDMGQLSINEDKTKYSFKLRDGLKWSDGKPLTAEDVYFTYHDYVMSPAFPNEILKTNFAGVTVTKENEKTVSFTLQKPNTFFATNLTTGILPKHILKDVQPFDIIGNPFNLMPVGSGPYMVSESPQTFPDGRMQITLSKNMNYYGNPVSIENIRILVYPTMDKLMNDLNSVNGVPKVTGQYISEIKDLPRFDLIKYELPQYTAVFMNMESEVLKEQNVRLALQKAIDKKELISNFIDKLPVDTPLMELDQEDWVYQASKDQAQGALKDAGYSYAKDDEEKTGFRYNKKGDRLSLQFVARLYDKDSYLFDETQKVVTFLEKAWEEIGIEIKVELLPEEAFKERISSRKYDLLLVGQNLGYNLDTYSYWHSTQAGPLGQNFSNYKSFQVDSIIENIRTIFDEEKREAELEKLAKKIKEDIPAVFLYRPLNYYATDGKITGINMSGVVFPSDRYDSISEWEFRN